jgi:endonuclease YncB( thermonuclease family)
MNKLYLISILVLLLACDHPESKEYERNENNATSISAIDKNRNNETETQNGYKVIGIKDGDTFVLLIDGKEQVVRFAHIDCPEKKQPFGNKAKQFVSEMCFGKYVTLIHSNKFDRNKRLIAEVILQDGTNLNKQLIKNGLAWHFKKYSKDTEYAELELQARQNKIGLWSDSDQIPPWEWRK